MFGSFKVAFTGVWHSNVKVGRQYLDPGRVLCYLFISLFRSQACNWNCCRDSLSRIRPVFCFFCDELREMSVNSLILC